MLFFMRTDFSVLEIRFFSHIVFQPNHQHLFILMDKQIYLSFPLFHLLAGLNGVVQDISQNDDPVQITDKIKFQILHFCTKKDFALLCLFHLTVYQSGDDLAVCLKSKACFVNALYHLLYIFRCLTIFVHTQTFYRQNVVFHIMQYFSRPFLLLLETLQIQIFQLIFLSGQSQLLMQLFLNLKDVIQVYSKQVKHKKKNQGYKQNLLTDQNVF